MKCLAAFQRLPFLVDKLVKKFSKERFSPFDKTFLGVLANLLYIFLWEGRQMRWYIARALLFSAIRIRILGGSELV
jgi:hypothetical protein